MNIKLNNIKNCAVFKLLSLKNKRNQRTLKNNNGKEYIPKFELIWSNSIINTISETSRADWWRRWLYSTNAKDIGMLYIYFAIFSGISIMPLKNKNLAIYWNNWYKNYVIIIIKIIIFNIKSVSIYNRFKSIIYFKYYRDFKQELLFNYFNIVKFLFLKKNYLILKTMSYRHMHNIGKLSKNKVLNDQLGYYLAGLIESDGSIITPKENSNNSPTISIVFHLDDKPLANHICKRLRYGSLEIIESNKAVKLYFRGKHSILKTISLINGKFRTPKIEKLHKLIKYINKNWDEQIKNPIDLLPLDNSSLDNNSWLSGFSDGDVNININISWPDKTKNGYGQIKLTFEIVQTRLDEEHFYRYKGIMEKIAIFLQSKLEKHSVSKYDRTGKQNVWRARIVNKKGVTTLVNYFNKYPMFSSKHLNFLSWRNAYIILIINREHIGANKLNTYNKIKLIKDEMNAKRTIFNWDHLNNFY